MAQVCDLIVCQIGSRQTVMTHKECELNGGTVVGKPDMSAVASASAQQLFILQLPNGNQGLGTMAQSKAPGVRLIGIAVNEAGKPFATGAHQATKAKKSVKAKKGAKAKRKAGAKK